MNMPIIVRLATKADLSNRSAAVALRDFEPLMTAVGQKRKGSDRAHHVRFVPNSRQNRDALVGRLRAQFRTSAALVLQPTKFEFVVKP